MKLIINSLNYSPELTGIGKYDGEMCPELIKSGFDVSAIVAPHYLDSHEQKKKLNRR